MSIKSIIIRSLMTIVILIDIVGCATGNPFPGTVAPSSDKGVVYVYRPTNSFASWGCSQFSIDGGAANPMQNGGYLRFELPKGDHLLKNKTSWCSVFPLERAFTLRDGETVFVRNNVRSDYKPGFHRYDGPDDIYSGYEIVAHEIAIEELKKLRAGSE